MRSSAPTQLNRVQKQTPTPNIQWTCNWHSILSQHGVHTTTLQRSPRNCACSPAPEHVSQVAHMLPIDCGTGALVRMNQLIHPIAQQQADVDYNGSGISQIGLISSGLSQTCNTHTVCHIFAHPRSGSISCCTRAHCAKFPHKHTHIRTHVNVFTTHTMGGQLKDVSHRMRHRSSASHQTTAVHCVNIG